MRLIAYVLLLIGLSQPAPIVAVYVPLARSFIISTDQEIMQTIHNIGSDKAARLQWNSVTGFDDVVHGRTWRVYQLALVYGDGAVRYFDIRIDEAGDYYAFESATRREWQADYSDDVAPHLTAGWSVEGKDMLLLKMQFEAMRR